MKSGIYIIQVDEYPGKYYVGSAYDFQKRWREHKNALKNNRHDCKHLQSIYNEGKTGLRFYVLEYVGDLSKLLDREDYYLQDYFDFDSELFNMCFIAFSALGVIRSKETRERISLRQLGQKHPHKGNVGFKHSEETKRNMSLSRMGNKYALGYKHTEETKQKIAETSRQMWRMRNA